MNNINQTLYIPLYGKSLVSKKGIIIKDQMAEKIWDAEGFSLKSKSRSKWLAYYMGMRSAVFDRWTEEHIGRFPESVVLHIGCGLDSRCLRVEKKPSAWYDVDFPAVIAERKRFFHATDSYQMIGHDARDSAVWAKIPPAKRAIVIMEGVSMYMKPAELTSLLQSFCAHFDHVALLVDCYSEFAAKASKYKNPINDVGVTEVYGLDDPMVLTENTGLRFIREREMTPQDLVDQLSGMEKMIFQKLYCGGIAQKMYHLYEYQK